ncbi:MAG: hypothetical protein JNJ56_05720 [Ignavibacteria bacterium]|nr:hypothetical protein [Ignavibacteria bacterium]
MKYINFILFVLLIAASSCGDKTDLSQFPITNNGGGPNLGDVVYVQQYPTWNQFNQPEAVLVGREPLVYVCDTKNNKLVQLDLSGVQIGELAIRNPVALAQDYNYDLLVIGDSVLQSNDTISVLYRIQLVPVQGFLSNATLLPLLGSDYPTPLTSRRRKFTGVSVFSNNTYLVTRIGPDNTSSLDPDNAILDIVGITSVTSVTPLSGFQTTGNGIYSIDMMSAITTMNNSTIDFIITRNSTGFGFKVEWFVYDNLKGTYNPKFLPDENVNILNKQLDTPVGICIDPNQNVYVVDNTKDSLFKYSSTGDLKSESFGGYGTGENQLNAPQGVSFFNKVLYIADTGNNRIVRYKLSTDIY